MKLQVWATWLFYAVLVDLGDVVADELVLPFNRISWEMVYSGLYHFSVAYDKGKATSPVKYFAEQRKSRFRSDLNAAKVRAELGFVTFSRNLLTSAQFS